MYPLRGGGVTILDFVKKTIWSFNLGKRWCLLNSDAYRKQIQRAVLSHLRRYINNHRN